MANITMQLDALLDTISNGLRSLTAVHTSHPPGSPSRATAEDLTARLTDVRTNLLHFCERHVDNLTAPQRTQAQRALSQLRASLSTFMTRLQRDGVAPDAPPAMLSALSYGSASHGLRDSLQSAVHTSICLRCAAAVVVVPFSALEEVGSSNGEQDVSARDAITLSVSAPHDALAMPLHALRRQCEYDDSNREKAECVIDAFDTLSAELHALDRNWALKGLSPHDRARVDRGASVMCQLLGSFAQQLELVDTPPVPSGRGTSGFGLTNSFNATASLNGVVVMAKLHSYEMIITSLRSFITKVRNGMNGIAASLARPAAGPGVAGGKRYDVFVSHAGPDKLTIAQPLHAALRRAGLHSFLDLEELKCSAASAPETMLRAMEEARVGIFILSPEFAVRRWPMKELRRFLQRNRENAADERPALVPVFFRLGIRDAPGVYDADSEHRHAVQTDHSNFFQPWRQTECSTDEARKAMGEIVKFSGVETKRVGGGERLSTAAVVERTVHLVESYLRPKDS